MKRLVIISVCLVFVLALAAQTKEDTSRGIVLHTNQIKTGASIQYDAGSFYYYNYDQYYQDLHYSFNDEGPNTHVYLSYEHIWTYPNKLAFGIEPKVGYSFREYASNIFTGVDWKFYWANKPTWRMGVYLYTGYGYDKNQYSIFAPMDGGHYQQRIDLTMHHHMFSTMLGFIPFQFKLRKVPMIIECDLGWFGMNFSWIRSNKYMNGEESSSRFLDNIVGPFFPKFELKLGFEL